MAGADGAEHAGNANEPTPIGQRLFDNMFLLLAAGILIMVAVYTGWGLYEILAMPAGTLP